MVSHLEENNIRTDITKGTISKTAQDGISKVVKARTRIKINKEVLVKGTGTTTARTKTRTNKGVQGRTTGTTVRVMARINSEVREIGIRVVSNNSN